VTSPEAQSWSVADAFRDVLERGADPRGAAFWSDALANGASTAQVLADIAASPEYVNNLLLSPPPAPHLDPIAGVQGGANPVSSGGAINTGKLTVSANDDAGTSFILFVD